MLDGVGRPPGKVASDNRKEKMEPAPQTSEEGHARQGPGMCRRPEAGMPRRCECAEARGWTRALRTHGQKGWGGQSMRPSRARLRTFF